MRRKLVVGNWKMNGSRVSNAQLLAGLREAGPWNADVAVCPPFPYLTEAALALTGSGIQLGGQDCSAHEQGAYTGEVSPGMLADLGCRYVIVGHSERRTYHGESDLLVADKAKAALARGVTPIVCVGETRAEREAGQTEAVVKRQLAAVIHGLGHCCGDPRCCHRRARRIGGRFSLSSVQEVGATSLEDSDFRYRMRGCSAGSPSKLAEQI